MPINTRGETVAPRNVKRRRGAKLDWIEQLGVFQHGKEQHTLETRKARSPLQAAYCWTVTASDGKRYQTSANSAKLARQSFSEKFPQLGIVKIALEKRFDGDPV